MSTRPFDKTIADIDGKEHHYQCIQHPAEEGIPLGLSLIQIASVSLGQLIASQRASQSGMGTGVGGSQVSPVKPNGEASDPSQDLDAELLGKSLDTMVSAIVAAGSVTMMKKLFKNTIRDGKKFTSNAVGLGDAWSINEAFTGNYQEMMKALYFVLESNFSNLFDGLQVESRKIPFLQNFAKQP